MSRRAKRYGLKETGTVFVLGEVFSPTWDDCHAAIARLSKLGVLDDLVPEVKTSVILAHRGALMRAVPTIIKRSAMKNYREKVPQVVLALLWVVACFNYKYCYGPYPGTIKRMKRPRRGPVLDFRCPFCGREFKPNPRFKSRRVILTQYINWLSRHADECDRLLYLDRSVK